MSFINIIGKTIKTIKSISGSDDTLNITDTDGSTESITINNVQTALSLNTLKRNTEYKIGDIAYSVNLPSWAVLECTTVGTSASIEPSFSSVQVGSTITDGMVTWTVRHRQDGHRVNDIWMTSGTFNKDGYLIDSILGTARFDVHLCDGNFGTPNLTNKFIMGSASIGSTGGANNLALTIDNLPSHSHSASAQTDEAGAHSHAYNAVQGGNIQSGTSDGRYSDPRNANTSTDGAHMHNVTVIIGNTGSGKEIDNRPSFYTLAFVKKIK